MKTQNMKLAGVEIQYAINEFCPMTHVKQLAAEVDINQIDFNLIGLNEKPFFRWTLDDWAILASHLIDLICRIFESDITNK